VPCCVVETELDKEDWKDPGPLGVGSDVVNTKGLRGSDGIEPIPGLNFGEGSNRDRDGREKSVGSGRLDG